MYLHGARAASSATVPSRNQTLTHDADNSPDGLTLAPAPPISEDDVNVDALVDISVGERNRSVLIPEADAYSLENMPGYSFHKSLVTFLILASTSW